MSSFVRFWGPPLALAAAIFWVSHQPRPVIGVGRWDWLAHAGAYLVLGLAMLRATHRGWPRWRPAAVAAAWLLTAAYGATDEIHQSFVPGREMSLMDALADAGGAAAAVVLLRLRVRRPSSADPTEER